MDKPSDNPAATLAEIRLIMERSTRFFSLSGLSGVAMGIIALLGAGIVCVKLKGTYDTYSLSYAFQSAGNHGASLFRFLGIVAALTIAAAAIAGAYFTKRRANAQGHTVWDNAARRLLINLAIPLTAGGIFSLLLFWHGAVDLILPAMLIFYGLALLHASKYTVDELRNLGMSVVALGLIAGFWTQYALFLWAIGFGLFTIIYGIRMYNRYERNSAVS